MGSMVHAEAGDTVAESPGVLGGMLHFQCTRCELAGRLHASR